MSDQLVSILIPCYNAEKWLAETLESVLAQTWQNIEIIVVDDGSTDGSLAIAKSYESRQLKVISQSNKGASAARNLAYKTCAGDYIQYLDADDLLATDKIEQQMISLKNSPGHVAAGQWSRFYKSINDVVFIQEAVWNDLPPVEWLTYSWMAGKMMALHAWLLPRNIADLVGDWNENLSLNDDGEYFCRVVLASKGVKFCQKAKSYYRSGLIGSLSGIKSYAAWQSALLSIQLCSQSLLAAEDSPRTRQVCATLFQRFIYEVYPDAPDLLAQAEAKLTEFGPSTLKPDGGLSFQLLSELVGWQQAKRWQRWAYQSGYQRFNWGWKVAKSIQRLAYQLRAQNQHFSAHE